MNDEGSGCGADGVSVIAKLSIIIRNKFNGKTQIRVSLSAICFAKQEEIMAPVL